MRMKKKYWLLFSFLLVCTLCISMGVYQQSANLKRLNEGQIEELRKDYPIYQLTSPPEVFRRYPSLDEAIEDADSFIYGEIIGGMETYSEYISTGIPALDEKQKRLGHNSATTFYKYTLRVIEDTEGVYKPGEELTITSNMEYINYKPQFEVGMKIVYGTVLSKYNPKETDYMTVGTYYVTDDGYALSAFPEEQKTMKSRGTYSGVKVEYLLKQLKKK